MYTCVFSHRLMAVFCFCCDFVAEWHRLWVQCVYCTCWHSFIKLSLTLQLAVFSRLASFTFSPWDTSSIHPVSLEAMDLLLQTQSAVFLWSFLRGRAAAGEPKADIKKCINSAAQSYWKLDISGVYPPKLQSFKYSLSVLPWSVFAWATAEGQWHKAGAWY